MVTQLKFPAQIEDLCLLWFYVQRNSRLLMFENCTAWWLGMSCTVIYFYYFGEAMTFHKLKL